MFVADPNALRTYDEHRGLTLRENGGSEGSQSYEIERYDGKKIRFSTYYSREFSEKWRQDHPRAVNPTIHIVARNRGFFSEVAKTQSDEIIRDALLAYKCVHGLPIRGDVFVFFEDNAGRIAELGS